jgi:hypothetical protein
MINAQMRTYEYYTLNERDEYGQQKLSTKPTGTIQMAINITSQSIQDNVNYKEAQYIGLTQADVKDAYVIKYGEGLLKVLYINPLGRYKQVFLTDYE